MSRSKRKVPITGVCGESEKEDKKIWHSRLRAVVRDRLQMFLPEDYLDPHFREVSNPWDMSKDGKMFHGWDYPEILRK